MKKFLILAAILIGIRSQAQFKNVSILAGVNYPMIKDVEKSVDRIVLPLPAATGYVSVSTAINGGITESFTSSIGYQIGGQIDYAFGSKFFLTSGLSVNLFRFQRKVSVSDLTVTNEQPVLIQPSSNVGQPFGSLYGGFTIRDATGRVVVSTDPMLYQRSENVGNTTSLSIQMPLLAGASFLKDKVELRMGPIFSYLLHATQIKHQYSSPGASSDYKDSSKGSFNQFQAGAVIQTSYRITQKFGIDFSAQKFFTAIYKDSSQAAGKAKYNALLLGLSYRL